MTWLGRPSLCNQTEVNVRGCLWRVSKSISSWDTGTELRFGFDFPRAKPRARRTRMEEYLDMNENEHKKNPAPSGTNLCLAAALVAVMVVAGLAFG